MPNENRAVFGVASSFFAVSAAFVSAALPNENKPVLGAGLAGGAPPNITLTGAEVELTG